jgi:hypothetical protein
MGNLADRGAVGRRRRPSGSRIERRMTRRGRMVHQLTAIPPRSPPVACLRVGRWWRGRDGYAGAVGFVDDVMDIGAVWRRNRLYLLAVAYRSLGSLSEAEDAVQEAFVRLHRARVAEVADVRAWLCTVVSRICLDQLRSARVRRECLGPAELRREPANRRQWHGGSGHRPCGPGAAASVSSARGGSGSDTPSFATAPARDSGAGTARRDPPRPPLRVMSAQRVVANQAAAVPGSRHSGRR